MDSHIFKITLNCEYCGGADVVKVTAFPCDWKKKCAYTGDDETFQGRHVGCMKCRKSVLMHFHCTPGWDDDDSACFTDVQTGDVHLLWVTVENIDP